MIYLIQRLLDLSTPKALHHGHPSILKIEVQHFTKSLADINVDFTGAEKNSEA